MSHACLQCFLFNLAFEFASRLAWTMKISLVVHPDGLHPVMQVKAHHLVKEEDVSYDDARDELHNMNGERPSKKSVWNSVQRVE